MDVRIPVGRRSERGKLQRVERAAKISVRDGGDMLERVLVGNRAHAPQAAFAVFERRAHAVEHVFTRQRIKLENAAAADIIGFSVVEPMKRIVPFSIAGRIESLCALFQRWHSSSSR